VFDDQDLLTEFVSETEEHLETAQNGLIILDRQYGRGALKINTVDQVFRAMHTIKGGAGFLNLDEMQILSHRMEEILSRVRERAIEVNSDMITTLLNGCDRIEEMLVAVQHGDNSVRAGDVIAQLEELDPMSEEARRLPPSARTSQMLARAGAAGSAEGFSVAHETVEYHRPPEHVYVYQLTYNLHDLEAAGASPVGIIGQLTPFGTVIDSRLDVPIQSLHDDGDFDTNLTLVIVYATMFDQNLILSCSSPAPNKADPLSDVAALPNIDQHLPDELSIPGRPITQGIQAPTAQSAAPQAVTSATAQAAAPTALAQQATAPAVADSTPVELTLVLPNGATIYCHRGYEISRFTEVLEQLKSL
jgi:two-component system chemotaxis sensor kinase CheA